MVFALGSQVSWPYCFRVTVSYIWGPPCLRVVKVKHNLTAMEGMHGIMY